MNEAASKESAMNVERSGWRHGSALATVLLALCLAGCGRGQNTDDVAIGSGQSTDSSANSGTDYPIFYVKRTTPDFATADDDARRRRGYFTNADLYMRDRASPSAAETNITARVRGGTDELWDIKDVSASFDGSKILFAMRGPIDENQDDDEPPYWNLYEYIIADDQLNRLTNSDNSAGDELQDIAPQYLPDGHILFSSTRQTRSKAVLLDENKGGFPAQDEDRGESAFVLHVMDANGTNIQQVSFNQSHDLDPTVLADGRILWSRWDHANGKNGMHLYTSNPDGTDVQLLYGAASHQTIEDTETESFPEVQFLKAREMRNGRILALVRPFNSTEFGGDLYIIDTNTYVEDNQATAANSGMVGPAQAKATPNAVRLVPGPSAGGRFISGVPLWDGSDRILTVWSQCRVLDADNNDAIVPCTSDRLEDPEVQSAPPLYSVWMYDPAQATMQPVVPPVEGVMVSDIATAQPRPVPTFRTTIPANNVNVNATFAGEGVGVLDIRSVYDFDGAIGGGVTSVSSVAFPGSTGYNNRPARFLRIEKAVSIPSQDVRDIDNSAFGVSNFMREILGYVPIEPDGSVRVKVPANVAFQISVLDSNGRRLTNNFSRHNAWLSLRPGETVSCNGCHRPQAGQDGISGVSHGRAGLFTPLYSDTAASSNNTETIFANSSLNATFRSAHLSGETMAQTRGRWSCTNEQCRAITPSVDVEFARVWPVGNDPYVIPAAARAGDFTYSYTGSDGLRTLLPTSSSCATSAWSSTCRITINYLDHIQPIWERQLDADVNGDTVMNASDNCLACHSRTDAANAARVPASQLELVSDASDQNGAGIQVTSYRELLFTDNELTLNGATLEDRCVQTGIDPVTMQTVCLQFATVSPSLQALNARGSRFFQVFSQNTGTVDHTSFLTAGELRLISEWVDIGAQYYNDPFAAPED